VQQSNLPFQFTYLPNQVVWQWAIPAWEDYRMVAAEW